MEMLIDRPDFNLKQFGERLARDVQEGVKWERRKLEWILEEKKKLAEAGNHSAE